MNRITLIGLSLLLIAAPVQAEKLMDSDTTWKAGASPISVSEDTTVKAGVTLTVEPGITVELAADSYLK